MEKSFDPGSRIFDVTLPVHVCLLHVQPGAKPSRLSLSGSRWSRWVHWKRTSHMTSIFRSLKLAAALFPPAISILVSDVVEHRFIFPPFGSAPPFLPV